MLTPHLRSQFVTKVLTSPTGEQFKVVFLVAIVNGEVKAQVISATPIENGEKMSREKSQAGAPPCLPLVKCDQNLVTFTNTRKGTFSAQLFNELFFFNSQPTRAPSL